MERLYALSNTQDSLKKDLYVKSVGSVKDYFTYFNSFPLQQWRRYTTIQEITVRIEIRGNANIIFYYAEKGSFRELYRQDAIGDGIFCKTFNADQLPGDIIGFRVVLLDADSSVVSGAYYGRFSYWHAQRIGVGICTYRREDYVMRTLKVLNEFAQEHSWIRGLVVDNGRTLQPNHDTNFRIVPNRNFGGSGGFARAMIEYVSSDDVDYVLLMDDDIVIEPSVLERSYALLSGLKQEYRQCFLGGAMLSLEHPTIQYENTAYWDNIKLHAYGRNLDLSVRENLVSNLEIEQKERTYAAWWYCCMPLERIKQNGYPLPLFIKGDDMEYGLRNKREILFMNGIGVWHEAFGKKDSLYTRYFTSRNMFILNHFSGGPRRIGQILSILERLLQQGILYGPRGIKAMYLSLRDYCKGLQELVKTGSDIQAKQVAEELEQPLTIRECYAVMRYIVYSIVFFGRLDKSYKKFRCENLMNDRFWRNFMGIDEGIA